MILLNRLFFKPLQTILKILYFTASLFIAVTALHSSSADTVECKKAFYPKRSKIALKSFLSDPQNINKYKTQKGFIRFAEEYFRIFDENIHIDTLSMSTIFYNASQTLPRAVFEKLGWQRYDGRLKQLKAEYKQILNTAGKIKVKYKNKSGYAQYTSEFYDGNMSIAFRNVSAILKKKQFADLGWQKYEGFLAEFKREQQRLSNKTGGVKTEYKNSQGYRKYANRFYSGDMEKTFRNASAVLEKEQFTKLKWKKYHGSTVQYERERNRILNSKGEVKYREIEGQVAYANQYYKGNMYKAFRMVYDVLTKQERLFLNWRIFYGTTGHFYALIQYFEHHHFESLKGLQGQKQIAEFLFNGHLYNTYRNVMSLRDYLLDYTGGKWSTLRDSGWKKSTK